MKGEPPPPSRQPRRLWLPIGIIALAFAAVLAVSGIRSSSQSEGTAMHDVQPSSLFHLPELTGESTTPTDIALMNLLCAAGLRGAEALDIEWTLSELDRWAGHVKSETDRHMHRFRRNPAEYENSEAYFRMLMLITVVQQDMGVRYSPDRIDDPDFTNSQDLFIHGMVTRNPATANGGTCVSMPVLYVAIGRRLGYPLKLALTKPHVFARWDAPDHPNPSLRGRFNVEAAGLGLSTPEDERYTQPPYWLTEADLKSGWYLRSLTPAEELAVFLMNRGHCLADTGRLEEAQEAYAMANRLAPNSEAVAHLFQATYHDVLARRGMDAQPIVANHQADPVQFVRDERRSMGDSAEGFLLPYDQQSRDRGRQPPPGTVPVDSPVVYPNPSQSQSPSSDD